MTSFTRITDRRGLTLIEVAVAIAIMVVLFAWIFGPLTLGFGLFGRSAGKAALKQDAAVAADTLRKDIREAAAVYLTGGTDPDTDAESGLIMGNIWASVKFIPVRTCKVQSFSFRIRCEGDISNNTAGLEGYLYAGDNAPVSWMGTTGLVEYRNIDTDYKETIFKLPSACQVTQGSTYWLVLRQSQMPAGGNILLAGGVIGEMVTAHSDDGSVWTATGDQAAWYGVYNDDGTYFIYGQQLNLKMPYKPGQAVDIDTGIPLSPLKTDGGDLWCYYTEYDADKKVYHLIKKISDGLNSLTGEANAVTSFTMDNNGLVTVDLLLKSDKGSGKKERIRLTLKSRPLSK